MLEVRKVRWLVPPLPSDLEAGKFPQSVGWALWQAAAAVQEVCL